MPNDHHAVIADVYLDRNGRRILFDDLDHTFGHIAVGWHDKPDESCRFVDLSTKDCTGIATINRTIRKPIANLVIVLAA